MLLQDAQRERKEDGERKKREATRGGKFLDDPKYVAPEDEFKKVIDLVLYVFGALKFEKVPLTA